MKQLIFVFLFMGFFLHGYAQIDFGKVKQDKKYCKHHNFPENCEDVFTNNICNSTNLLEIRYIWLQPDYLRKVRILAYDTLHGWRAVEYTDSITRVTDKEICAKSLTKAVPLHPRSTFDSIFLQLKANDIFTLESEYALGHFANVGPRVMNGIYFKAGNKFRSYNFHDPYYLLEIQNYPYFKKVRNIIHLITMDLQITE